MFIILGLIVALMLYQMNRSDNGFRFVDALMTDGKADHTKIGYFIAITCLTWVVFHYAVHFALTEWLATIYVGAAVFAVLGYKGLRVGQDAVNTWQTQKTGIAGPPLSDRGPPKKEPET
ncbi:hypothetical protein UFOVP1040_61 [uncultured Caudovirales phage]|uniref:Uncharacterized protein n=1 Tax=uncultured Caudovirales phage TaxID=2100421 RepID=A0A6J5QAB3_9CAUD|nr:hypothetical protein UFOVP1040_61 [uncultured Caudovirales phage]